jgi:Tfp pilus assembly protein PilN
VIAGLSILLGFEVLVAYAFKTGSPWLQRRKVAVEIEEMRNRTAETQEMRSKNKVFRKQLYQLDKISKSRTGTMMMLKAISDTLPEDTYLQQLQNSDGELRLKGKSKEPDRLPELMLSLPFVDSLSESEIGRKEGDYYEFKLNVSLR